MVILFLFIYLLNYHCLGLIITIGICMASLSFIHFFLDCNYISHIASNSAQCYGQIYSIIYHSKNLNMSYLFKHILSSSIRAQQTVEASGGGETNYAQSSSGIYITIYKIKKYKTTQAYVYFFFQKKLFSRFSDLPINIDLKFSKEENISCKTNVACFTQFKTREII